MDSKKNNICKLLTIIMLSMYVGTSTPTNIDCDGKAFHCVNATHFMICVDLGAGVSKTVDDFMIKCPPTTVCRRNNNFECEYQLATTTQSIIRPGDETNDDTIPSQLSTVINNDITDTNNPIQKTNVTSLFSDYHNTIDVPHTSYAPEMRTETLTSDDDFEFVIDDGQNKNDSLKLVISLKDKNLSELINLATISSDIQNVSNRDEFISPTNMLHNTTMDATATRNSFNLADKEVTTPNFINEANTYRKNNMQATATESGNTSINSVSINFTTAQTTSLTIDPIIKDNKTFAKIENIKIASNLNPITQGIQNILLGNPLTSVNITQVDNLVGPEEVITEITIVKQRKSSNFNATMPIIEHTAPNKGINISLPYELNALNINENNYFTTPSLMSEPTLTPTDYVDDTNHMIVTTTASIHNLYDYGTVFVKYDNETAIPVEGFTSTSDEINITSTSNYKQTTENSIQISEVDMSDKNIQEMVTESTLTSPNLNDINTLWPDDDLLELTSATIIDNSQFNDTFLNILHHSTTTSDLNTLGQIPQDHVNASLTYKRNITVVTLEDTISTIDDNIPNVSVSPTFHTTNDDLKTLSYVTNLDLSSNSGGNVTDTVEAMKSTTASSTYAYDKIIIQNEMSPNLETNYSASPISVSSRNYGTNTDNVRIETDMTSVFDDYSTHEKFTTTNDLSSVDQDIGVMVTESIQDDQKLLTSMSLASLEGNIKKPTSSVVTENSNFYDTSVTVIVTPPSVINSKKYVKQDKIVSHEQYNISETSMVTDIPTTDTYTRDLSDDTDFTTTSSLSIIATDFIEHVTDRIGLLEITKVPYIEINEMETVSLYNENPRKMFQEAEDGTLNTRSSWQDTILTSTGKQDPVESVYGHVNLIEITTETQTRNIYGTTEQTMNRDKITTVPRMEERISENIYPAKVTNQHQQAPNVIIRRKDEITTETSLWQTSYLPNTEILVEDHIPIPSTIKPLARTLRTTLGEISTTHNQMTTTKYPEVVMSTDNNGMSVYLQNNEEQETSSNINDVGLTYNLLTQGQQLIDERVNPGTEMNYSTKQAFNDHITPTLQDKIATETSLWKTSYVSNTEMLVANDKPISSTPKPLATTLKSKIDEMLLIYDQMNINELPNKYLSTLSTKNPGVVTSLENYGLNASVQNNEDQEISSYVNNVGLTTNLLIPAETELNYIISKGTESTQTIDKIGFEKSDKIYLTNRSLNTFKSIKPKNEDNITNYNFETSIIQQAFNDNVTPSLQDQITTETSLWETSYAPNAEMLEANNEPISSTSKPLATTLTSKKYEILSMHDQMNTKLSKKYLSTKIPVVVMSTENNGMSVSVQHNDEQEAFSHSNDVSLTTTFLTPGLQLTDEKVSPVTELNYSISKGTVSSQTTNTTVSEKSDKTYSSSKSSTTLNSIKPNNEIKITNNNFETSITEEAFDANVRPTLQDQITTETSLWETLYVPNTEILVANDKIIPSTAKPLETTLTSKVDEILSINDQMYTGLPKKYLNSLSTKNPDVVMSSEYNGMSVQNNEDQQTSSYMNDVGLTIKSLAPGQQVMDERLSPETKLNYTVSKGTESTHAINTIVFENSNKTYLSKESSTTLENIENNNEIDITNNNFETSITQEAFNAIIRRKDEITTETPRWGTSYFPNTEILVTDDTLIPSTLTHLPTTLISKVDETSNNKPYNTYSSIQFSTTLKDIKANNEVKITNHNFENSSVSPLVEQSNLMPISVQGPSDNVTKEAMPINVVNHSKLQPNVWSVDYPDFLNTTMAGNYTTNDVDLYNTTTTVPISDSSIILQHTAENNNFYIKGNQFNTSNKDRVSNKRSVLVRTETPLYDTSSTTENNQLISNNKTNPPLFTALYFETNTSKASEIKSNFQTVLKSIDNTYLEINEVTNILDDKNSTRTTSNASHGYILPTSPIRYTGSITTKSYPEVQIFPEVSSQKFLYDKFNHTLQNDHPGLTSTKGSSYKSDDFDNTKTDVNNTMTLRDIHIVNKTILAATSEVVTKPRNNINVSIKANQSSLTNLFTCKNHLRGRFADTDNCRKYYICIGKIQPILGQCPTNTVFSEIKKQCTKNLSHCIRNSQFRCIQEGRFSDVLRNNIYYICVNNNNSFVRFQFRCQNGFHLNKTIVRCVNYRQFNSQIVSMSLDTSNKGSDQSTVEGKSKEKIQAKEDSKYTCKHEGKFPVAEDCRRYYVCSKNSKSVFRRRTKKCDSDEVFHREKKKCVDRDSYECS